MTHLALDAEAVKRQVDRLRAHYPGLAGDEEDMLLALASETDFEELAERIVKQIRFAALDAVAVKSFEEELKARRERHEQREDAYRTMLSGLMDAAGVSKLTLPIATVSITAGRPKAIVTDEAALPDGMKRVRVEPDKTAILDALKNGKTIPGAELSNGAPSLTIRVK